MLVKIIAISSQKTTPSERLLRGGLCLLALAIAVKPLAQAVGYHLRCDSYNKVDKNLSQATHLPSVARME